MISWVARRWEDDGYRVSHIYGPDESAEADVLIVHVNVSVVPDRYLQFAKRFPVAVNSALIDIRKRTISANLVKREDEYDGPVIVKTDLNYGGIMEELTGRGELRPLSFVQRVKRKLKIKDPSLIRSPKDYLVYQSKKAVPARVFKDPELVVERFVPEKHDDEYYHRRYVFLGDAECNVIWAGRDPINANDEDGHRSWNEPVPPELRKLRLEFGADYGKIDYAIVDGRVEIFDINRTPGGTVHPEHPGDTHAPWVRETVDQLAQGITKWLPA